LDAITLVYLKHAIEKYCKKRHAGKVIKDDLNYTIINTYDFDIIIPKQYIRGHTYAIYFCRNKILFHRIIVMNNCYKVGRDEVTRFYKKLINETSIQKE
jgi:hypothetical protein